MPGNTGKFHRLIPRFGIFRPTLLCYTDAIRSPSSTRGKANHLVFFFKVVEGLVPALQIRVYLTQFGGKCLIKSRKFKDCVTHNIIDIQAINNSRCFKIVECKTELLRSSFFPKQLLTGTIFFFFFFPL